MAGSLIRVAVAGDVSFIRRCAVAAYSKYVDRIGREPAPMVADFAAAVSRGEVAVVCAGAAPAGFVIFYPLDSEMHLENIAVCPEYCGNGFGKSLIGYVENEAVRVGVNAVFLYTNELMTENLSMYPSLGYSEYKRCTEDGFNRVYFRKKLS